MPKVSVIIPCYNDGRFVTQAIESIQTQTFTDWEIIVVNDGSTDAETVQILNRLHYANTLVLHKENGHLSSARNYGIRQAQGDYILTLDADDWFKPSFLEKAVIILDNDKKAGVVTSYMQCFGMNGKRWRPLGGSIENFLYRNQCNASALFRKQCWEEAGKYDEFMKKGLEDWEFWIRVTSLGWQVVVIREFLFHYRVSEKSMLLNETQPRMAEIIDYILNKHSQLYLEQLKEGMVAKKVFDFRKADQLRFLFKPFTDYWQER